jgi:hypothetical protein
MEWAKKAIRVRHDFVAAYLALAHAYIKLNLFMDGKKIMSGLQLTHSWR